MECGVRSVKYKVWSGKCRVWCVKCGVVVSKVRSGKVWSVE